MCLFQCSRFLGLVLFCRLAAALFCGHLAAALFDALSQWLAAQPVPPGAKPLHEWPAGRKMPVACGGVSVEAAPTGVTR